MQIKKGLPIIAIILLFNSCSWVNYFYIVNDTVKPITLDFNIMDTLRGFPIFYNESDSPQAYGVLKNGRPDFDKPVTVQKEKSERPFNFKITLPPHTALKIGELHNDKYSSHKQKFINDRIFNLKQIMITNEKGSGLLLMDEFDTDLVNEDGNYIFRINDK